MVGRRDESHHPVVPDPRQPKALFSVFHGCSTFFSAKTSVLFYAAYMKPACFYNSLPLPNLQVPKEWASLALRIELHLTLTKLSCRPKYWKSRHLLMRWVCPERRCGQRRRERSRSWHYCRSCPLPMAYLRRHDFAKWYCHLILASTLEDSPTHSLDSSCKWSESPCHHPQCTNKNTESHGSVYLSALKNPVILTETHAKCPILQVVLHLENGRSSSQESSRSKRSGQAQTLKRIPNFERNQMEKNRGKCYRRRPVWI